MAAAFADFCQRNQAKKIVFFGTETDIETKPIKGI
jgi:hypothetical protein